MILFIMRTILINVKLFKVLTAGHVLR